MSPTTQKRREVILARLLAQGHVAVKDLAEEMDSSASTVRRDLRALADEGRLELVHGGAVLARSKDFSFDSKSERNVPAKRAIGKRAAGLVADGDQILIDSGTTCFEMVPFLKARRGLSVIVNSVRHAIELNGPGQKVILLGGQYRPDRMDAVGPMAAASLDRLRGYTAFVGVDGLSMEFGLSAGDIESAELFGLAIRNAREAILLADHSKFLAPSLCKIMDFEAISRVVTDRRPTPAWMEYFESLGIDVLCADTEVPAEPGDRTGELTEPAHETQPTQPSAQAPTTPGPTEE
jgi:DeoR/GlpR family transcriptional regulator of sugar metabolism